jgi:hypothetical protein
VSEPYPPDAKAHLELAGRALADASAAGGRRWTLNGAIGAWRELVAQVEQGYDDVVEEYADDLAVRDRLQAVLAVLPQGAVRTWVAREIEDIDGRFRAATRESDVGGADEPWWRRRVPKVLVGQPASDLEAVRADRA